MVNPGNNQRVIQLEEPAAPEQTIRHRAQAYLRLLRPGSLVTAHADVLAGFAIVGATEWASLIWLLLATTGLYAGGMVLNDVFDAKTDAVTHPQRPIPSGLVPRQAAIVLGTGLMQLGVVAAFIAGMRSGLLALDIAIIAVAFNIWGKRHLLSGPLLLGICRGLNLLLGMSVVPVALAERWPLGAIPLVYIAAVTLMNTGIARDERRGVERIALVLLGTVIGMLLFVYLWPAIHPLEMLPALVLFILVMAPLFWRAYRQPSAPAVRSAVRMGILSIILLDAILATAYAGPVYGLIILALLIPAAVLMRLTAV